MILTRIMIKEKQERISRNRRSRQIPQKSPISSNTTLFLKCIFDNMRIERIDIMPKNKRDEKSQKKELGKVLFLAFILVILLVGINYIVFQTDLLKSHVDDKTLKYISFYNKEKTDSIIIKNIKKMTNKKGESTKNKSSLELTVIGKKNEKYEIVLYGQIDKSAEEFINVFTEHKLKKRKSNLKKLKNSKDGGKIIYQGKIDNNDIILRMWLSKEYSKKIKNNFFEVKIKSGWEQ